MPKPVADINGSGMHFNMSLFTEEGNAFYDASDEQQLSRSAYQFIAGILDHAQAYTAICNPTINSYKRLTPGFEAPVYVAWSGTNRTPLVRVPASRGMSTRVELRSVDPSANPYLALSVLLKAGMKGISEAKTAPNPVNQNIYNMDQIERSANNIESLPRSLYEAVQYLKQDETIKDALGNHIYERFVSAKEQDWFEYSLSVSEWEKNRYFETY